MVSLPMDTIFSFLRLRGATFCSFYTPTRKQKHQNHPDSQAVKKLLKTWKSSNLILIHARRLISPCRPSSRFSHYDLPRMQSLRINENWKSPLESTRCRTIKWLTWSTRRTVQAASAAYLRAKNLFRIKIHITSLLTQ